MRRDYCHKVLPAVFDDSLSYYEVLCRLTDKVNEIISTYDDLQAQIDSLDSRIKDNDADIAKLFGLVSDLDDKVESYNSNVLSLITEIFSILDKIGDSQLQWDCQLGVYKDTMQAQRDMFNDVTVHGITCDDMTANVDTVDGLANCGLNVRGVAVMGLWLLESFDIPEYFRYTNGGTQGESGILTVMDLQSGKINPEGYFVKGE